MDWPNELYLPNALTTMSRDSWADILLTHTGAGASSAWPIANLAMYVPFVLQVPVVATQLFWMNGATAAGNVCMAIYRQDLVRLATTGSTAQSGTSVLQFVNITDIALMPGRYFWGIAMDGTTGTYWRQAPLTAVNRIGGLFQQSTAFVLPDPAVPATIAQNAIPSPMGMTFASGRIL